MTPIMNWNKIRKYKDIFIVVLIILVDIFVIFVPYLNIIFTSARETAIDDALKTIIQDEAFFLNRISLNNGWIYKFGSYYYGIENEYYGIINDSDWHHIDVPFEFLVSEKNNSLWLRKHFYVSSKLSGKRIRLVFWGAYQIAYVWINGILLGRHEGYFTPFYFDITEHINYGSNNTISVFLTIPFERNMLNKKQVLGFYNNGEYKLYPRYVKDILPLGYKNRVPLGLWRSVELLYSGNIYVKFTLIDTFYDYEKREAIINIRYLIKNSAENEAEGILNYSIIELDSSKRVMSGSLKIKLNGREEKWFKETIRITDPKLWWTWDYGKQNLYSLNTSIYISSKLQGFQKIIFGIRNFKWEFSRNRFIFYLNNKSIFLRGGNYISNYLLYRSNLSIFSKDLKLFKEANINFIRVYDHIEPYEFYITAAKNGFLIQSDFPLIGAYGYYLKGNALFDFNYKIQIQFAEVFLYLYNIPNIAIWSLHDEPPWGSPWMGDAFKKGLNRDLDNLLLNLARILDKNGRMFIYEGVNAQHIFNGWKYGSWIDFRYISVSYLSDFGTQSLPYINSSLWKILNVNKWPIEKNSESYYNLLLYGFQENSWYRYIGPFSNYKNLTEYIERSQEYQSLVLKTAIDRFRILKFNVTGGITFSTLTDYLPGITYSIIDFERHVKKAYYTVKNSYSLTRVVIDWSGEYNIENNYKIVYEPNATALFKLWLINDDPYVKGIANITFIIRDCETGKILFYKEFRTTIPSFNQPSKKILELSWNVPVFIGNNHTLEAVAIIKSDKGEIINKDTFSFIVPGYSEIIGYLNIKKSLKFLTIINNNIKFIKSYNGIFKIIAPKNSNVRILGPVYSNSKDVYVPLDITLKLSSEKMNINFTLLRGAIINIDFSNPQIKHKEVPIPLIKVKYIKEDYPYVITLYDFKKNMFLLNLSSSKIIVKANEPLQISIRVYDMNYTFGNISNPIILKENQVYNISDISRRITQEDLDIVCNEIEKVSRQLIYYKRNGLYLGLEDSVLKNVEAEIKKANISILENDYVQASYLIRDAYEKILNVKNRTLNVYSISGGGIIVLFFLTMVASFGLASLLIEDDNTRFLGSIVIYAIVQSIVYRVYPGFSSINILDVLTAIYTIFISIVLFIIIPRMVEGIRTKGGIPLISAIHIALSIGVRNLRRRKTRTLLVLITIISMIIAVTNLSSVSYEYNTREVIQGKTIPPNVKSLVVIYKPDNKFFEFNEVIQILSNPKIVEVSYKIDSVPIKQGYVNSPFRISAFIGIDNNFPTLVSLEKYVYPKNVIEYILKKDYAILISERVAKQYNMHVGEKIFLNNIELTIVGYFDPYGIRELRDKNSLGWLPLAYTRIGNINYSSSDEFIITNSFTALSLGGKIRRIYIYTQGPDDAINLGKRLNLLYSYIVYVEPSGKNARVISYRTSIEFKGWEVIFPLVLAILNVATIMVAAVYERKREVFILASLGLNPNHILLLFFAEALILGLVGGMIGYIIGLFMFSIFNVFNIQIPVDIKTSIFDMSIIVFLSVSTSMFASLIPAMKASHLAVPSLRRKWKLEAEKREGNLWELKVPTRIPSKNIENFVTYLVDRLNEESGVTVFSIENLKIEKTETSVNKPLYNITYTYKRSGRNPFTADSKIIIFPENDHYSLKIQILPRSIYSSFAPIQVREVATLIRNLTFEWTALRIRVIIPVGEKIDNVVRVVKHYNPQYLLVVTRKYKGNLKRDIMIHLYNLGLKSPAIEVVKVEGNLSNLINLLAEYMSKIDVACIDSDDGILSSALSIASALGNKRICNFINGNVEEYNPQKILRDLGIK